MTIKEFNTAGEETGYIDIPVDIRELSEESKVRIITEVLKYRESLYINSIKNENEFKKSVCDAVKDTIQYAMVEFSPIISSFLSTSSTKVKPKPNKFRNPEDVGIK